MLENIRAALPRFQRSDAIVRVDSLLRSKTREMLPPLMEDTRRSYLAVYQPENAEMVVYLKAVAVPYTGENGIHLLAIPDRPDHQDIQSVSDLSEWEFARALQFSEFVARQTLIQDGIEEVDFGWHFAREGVDQRPKNRIASSPRNLHLHITGYSGQDMIPVATSKIRQDPLLASIADDAISPLLQQIIFNEVIPSTGEVYPFFGEFFEEVEMRGKKRLKVKNQAFSDQRLAVLLRALDLNGRSSYDQLAKCFFVFDEDSQSYVKDDDEYQRFKPLQSVESDRRLTQYFSSRSWLTAGAKSGLRWLAYLAKSASEVVDIELRKAEQVKGAILTDSEKSRITSYSADRFWIFRDFVYAMVFSSSKNSYIDNDWVFSFDPKIFSTGGMSLSSANRAKFLNKNPRLSYDPMQLQVIQTKERQLIDQLLAANPNLEIGPGIEMNV